MQMQLKYRFAMSGFYRGATIITVYRPALILLLIERPDCGSRASYRGRGALGSPTPPEFHEINYYLMVFCGYDL